jgi:3-oxoacyl-[acyl-carrier-protein] synthase II
VILGSGGGAQEFSEEQYRLWHSGHVKQVSLFCIPSGTMGTISSEVSMRFGFRGYSHVVTAGCTSSSDALGYAYQHIQAGVQPMFLVGGVDAPITPGIIKGYSLLRALTQSWNDQPERASRPFSADRDGFVLAEGSWMFVLEEYEHARARGAHVHAELVGYAATCEAFHRVRMSDSPEEPARAITLALEEARLAPEDIHYVNLHGTSTEMNDRVETQALKLALGEQAGKIPMSGLKSQIGHAQGACGAAGLAATLIAMQEGQIPPTINLDQPDPLWTMFPILAERLGSNTRSAIVWDLGRRIQRWCCARSHSASTRTGGTSVAPPSVLAFSIFPPHSTIYTLGSAPVWPIRKKRS